MSHFRYPQSSSFVLERDLSAIRKLGISDFESAELVLAKQADVLECLKANAWLRRLRQKLQGCNGPRCGNNKCVELCPLADWRRRLQIMPAAHRLLTQADGPVCEIKVVRGEWQRRLGELWDVNLPAIKQMNQRALDKVNAPSLVAVGTFKALIGKTFQPHWVCQITNWLPARTVRLSNRRSLLSGGEGCSTARCGWRRSRIWDRRSAKSFEPICRGGIIL